MTAPALLLALALAAGSLAAPTEAPEPDWRPAVERLLEARAKAVREGDVDAFLATMTGAPEAFRSRQRAVLERLAAVGIGEYRLEIDDRAWRDLAPALEDPPPAEEVHVVPVRQRLGLAGFDPEPAADTLFLTIARTGERWSVVADDGLDGLGLKSSHELWDSGPVARLERDGVLALFHPGDEADARRVVAPVAAQAERIASAWPYEWPREVVVMVPSSAKELQRILQATFDLGPFVAFLASGIDRDDDGARYVGNRMFIQPETFFDYSESFRAETIGHELLHLATRPLNNVWAPSWLEEGVAQYYGEEEAAGDAALRAAARRGDLDGLPEDDIFFTGSRDEIRVAYQAAYSFIAFLGREYGNDAGARLYKALAERSANEPGTWRWQVDRAARAALGQTFNSLEAAWRRSLGA